MEDHGNRGGQAPLPTQQTAGDLQPRSRVDGDQDRSHRGQGFLL